MTEEARAASSGRASRAIIVSSAWIVLSAPLLRLILPSGCRPSKVMPVAGSYIGSPARLAPKNHAACIPASASKPREPVASATASSDCTRESAP